MQPPVAPKLSEFGLTPEKIRAIPDFTFRSVDAFIAARLKIIGTSISALAFVWVWVRYYPAAELTEELNIGEFLEHVIRSAFAGVFIGLLGVVTVVLATSLLLHTFSKVAQWVQSAFGSGEQRAAIRFRLAYDHYEKERREYEKWLLRQSADFWLSLGGIEFEQEVGNLYKAMGYQVQFTPTTGDGGVDLILRHGIDVIVVQCKAHASKVGIATARELVASMSDFNANSAILVAASGVTKPTRDYCAKRGIQILDAMDLAKAQRQVN